MALPAVEEAGGVMPVEDFLAHLQANPPESSFGNDRKNRNGRGRNSGSRTISFAPPPLSPRPHGSPPAVGAFKITTEITTTYIKDLHEMIQRITPGNGPNCLQVTYDVQNTSDDEGRVMPSFWAKLNISGVKGLEGEWVDKGPFASKKLAKEAVAKKGGEWLKDMVKGWGRQGGRMGGGAKGGVLVPGAEMGEGVEIVGEEEEERLLNGEWVGRLNTYTQRSRFKSPTYTFYSTLTSSAFSCTVAIPELTGHSVSTPLPNANPTEFGSAKTFYRKKNTARAAAAREAVLWIWSVDPAAKSAALLSPGSRQLATLPGSSLTASSSSYTPGVVKIQIPDELKDARAPQLVAWLCPQLALCALEYVFESPANVTNLVDAWGRVKRVKPGVGVDQFVELGPVQNIFGKPTAKAKIAELCLYWMCRRESVRLGVKIVGLREEFYEEFEDGEDDGGSINGVVEGGTRCASVKSAGVRSASVSSGSGASTKSASIVGGEPQIKQEEISDEEEENDTMSLA